jgi:glutamyl-tRNA synthetase
MEIAMGLAQLSRVRRARKRMTELAPYRGRLAPSPTGYLHRGHAATFHIAQNRARAAGGMLLLRVEDLDRQRCRPEYAEALIADMRWAGLEWQEGPYRQSERMGLYLAAWQKLAAQGDIYPCTCTRAEVARALSAPHPGEHEPVYPGACRPAERTPVLNASPDGVNWRLRTAPGEIVEFCDGCAGPQAFRAGRDFGDFLVWRKDGFPSYQLAVVVDDAAMQITEVVRGADLLAATAPQLLLYRALGLAAPAFYHVPLVTDAHGQRLAKRAGAHSLRSLREAGVDPATLSM